MRFGCFFLLFSLALFLKSCGGELLSTAPKTLSDNPENGDIDDVIVYSKEFPDPANPNPWFDMTGNILLYHFNETTTQDSDTIYDSSTFETHGTFISGSTENRSIAEGYLGRALDFDFHYINLNGSNNFEISDVSISVWIKTSYSGEQDIVYNSYLNQYGWCLTFEEGAVGGGASVLFSNTNGGENHRKTVHGFTDGQWHHIVAVSAPNPADIKIYIDGEEQELAIDSEQTWANFSGPAVGAIGSGFKGVMDELAVFARRLTEEEALQIYNHQKRD